MCVCHLSFSFLIFIPYPLWGRGGCPPRRGYLRVLSLSSFTNSRITTATITALVTSAGMFSFIIFLLSCRFRFLILCTYYIPYGVFCQYLFCNFLTIYKIFLHKITSRFLYILHKSKKRQPRKAVLFLSPYLTARAFRFTSYPLCSRLSFRVCWKYRSRH